MPGLELTPLVTRSSQKSFCVVTPSALVHTLNGKHCCLETLPPIVLNMQTMTRLALDSMSLTQADKVSLPWVFILVSSWITLPTLTPVGFPSKYE